MSRDGANGSTGYLNRAPRHIWWIIAAGLVVAIAVALGVAVFFTSRPAFFTQYRSLEGSYTTLSQSSHADVACNECHVDPRGAAIYQTALVGEFYRGLVRTPKEPVFVEMTKPSSEACLTCHREDWSMDAKKTMKIPHPAHLRVANETRECVKCHKWTAHEEAYMEKHKEMPFSTVCASFGCHVGTKPASDCANCHHSLQESKGKWKLIHKQTVRSYGPNACLESCHDADQCRLCHTTGKTPVFATSGPSAGVKAIERQHVKKDWIAKHGTMALADPPKCLICHVSQGECQDCHSRRPAFHGPRSTWLGKHKDVSKDKRRCLTCHKEKWCDACHKQFKEMR
ncbi:MAG: NapC/NirT family cytochrome c [Actinomycetota bacterium]|nr:NapC/NirT family cytochrome c [Actinomycetota bacterium]